ncbi:MAG: hypothetical protein UY26_C0002G0015 [Candidatus Jorgensenbacteria bacterium GW2011_GWA1_48_13]|nr:MAG: hypothetical protein UY26_C0002G0015 [Candidatus Jorgensenbacteria bacterium GW2011_GWA1_48_13]KKW15495.1 MAG: hypothetical protein UY55_C0001G0249 [Candidatus Jorgensenbacteria bacterium GW2011_GWB1_50_10]
MSPREQERIQHERLVNRDFPWLWAVRSEWDFPAQEMTVQYAGKYNPLLKAFLAYNDSILKEIWVRVEVKHPRGKDYTGYSFSAVRKVDEPRDRSWAEAILCRVPYGGVTHLAILSYRHHQDGTEDRSRRQVTVYRPMKPEMTLDAFLLEAVEEAEKNKPRAWK